MVSYLHRAIVVGTVEVYGSIPVVPIQGVRMEHCGVLIVRIQEVSMVISPLLAHVWPVFGINKIFDNGM